MYSPAGRAPEDRRGVNTERQSSEAARVTSAQSLTPIVSLPPAPSDRLDDAHSADEPISTALSFAAPWRKMAISIEPRALPQEGSAPLVASFAAASRPRQPLPRHRP